MNIDTTPFQFTYTNEIILPCGKSWEFEYLCEAQAVLNYEHDELTGKDYFEGVSFDILSASLYGAEDVNIWGNSWDMVKFRQLLQARAQHEFEKRSGSTDFAEVIIHDRIEDMAVKVVDVVELTSKQRKDMSFYNELRTLSADPEYQAAINSIEYGQLPVKDRQRLILHAIRAIAPPVPSGKERMKDCFWKQLIAFAPVAVVGSTTFKERKAKWMREQRERAQANGHHWPPRPLIRHAYFPASTYSLRFID